MRRSSPLRVLTFLSLGCLPALAAAWLLIGPAAPTASGEGAARTFLIDKAHSALIFKVSHLGVSYTHGRFNDFSGSMIVDETNMKNSKIEIDIHAESIDTNSDDRDKHLRSKDYFDVEEHPSISFESTSITAAGTDEVRVKGTFTLLGIGQEVTFRMKKIGEGKDPWGGDRIGYEGQLVIKRSEHGMTTMVKEKIVGDEVYITLGIEGALKK